MESMSKLLTSVLIAAISLVLVACSGGTVTETLTHTQTKAETKTQTQTTTVTQSSGTTIPSHFATYKDVANYFSISYPSDWILFPSSMELFGISVKDFFEYYSAGVVLEGYIFVFTAESPRESGDSGANINIVVQSVSEVIAKGWLTLDEIVEGKLQRTAEISEGYHEYSRTETNIGGREAVIIDWESSYPDIGKTARTLQMFMIADGLVWKITCYVDSTKYDYFKDDLHAIVSSLRILN